MWFCYKLLVTVSRVSTRSTVASCLVNVPQQNTKKVEVDDGNLFILPKILILKKL